MNENRIYREWPIVHLLGPGMTGFFLYLAIQNAFSTPVNGGPVSQILLTLVFLGLGMGAGAFYLRGVCRYEPTDEGMKVHRLLKTTFHPWSDFWKIQQIAPLSIIIFRSRSGVIAFSSTNFFPDMGELLIIVNEKSNCRLEGFPVARD